MESESTKLLLIQLKMYCSIYVFRAEAIEHILMFAQKERIKILDEIQIKRL